VGGVARPLCFFLNARLRGRSHRRRRKKKKKNSCTRTHTHTPSHHRYCKHNTDAAFASCDTPQEKSDEEIDAEMDSADKEV
jgi:hypothetical protein